MPGSARQFWADRTPNRRRHTYPTCRGFHDVDVVVIGGGLTGCLAAYVAAAAGRRVVLLERERLATASTAAGAGVIVPDPGASFREAAAVHGRRVARAAWRQARHAGLDLAATLRRAGIRCDLTPTSLLINARTPDAASDLKREQAARKGAGFDAGWLSAAKVAAETGSESHGALRVKDAFTFDPVRAALGLAVAAARRGARIHERTEVRRTQFDRKHAEVVLANGRIRARQIVVATSGPGATFGPLRRHFRQQTSFAVVTDPWTAPMRRGAGRRATVVTEWGDEPRWLRWLPDDRALFAGHAGPAVGSRQLDKVLAAHAGELMYELSVRYPVISGLPASYAWPQSMVTPIDGLPWIGSHRNYPFHFFALGLADRGAGLAAFAARAAARALAGEPATDDETFAR